MSVYKSVLNIYDMYRITNISIIFILNLSYNYIIDKITNISLESQYYFVRQHLRTRIFKLNVMY